MLSTHTLQKRNIPKFSRMLAEYIAKVLHWRLSILGGYILFIAYFFIMAPVRWQMIG